MADSALMKKLGLKPGDRALLLNAPPEYPPQLAQELPADIDITEHPGGIFPFVHLFILNSDQFRSLYSTTMQSIKYDGLLWISYPKKSAKMESDLSREKVWELMENSGWRAVTQISIDETWSALRFSPTKSVGS